jgi:hypothetical protein
MDLGTNLPRSSPVRSHFQLALDCRSLRKVQRYLARSDQGCLPVGSFRNRNLSSTSPVIALAAGSVSGDSDKQLRREML